MVGGIVVRKQSTRLKLSRANRKSLRLRYRQMLRDVQPGSGQDDQRSSARAILLLLEMSQRASR